MHILHETLRSSLRRTGTLSCRIYFGIHTRGKNAWILKQVQDDRKAYRVRFQEDGYFLVSAVVMILFLTAIGLTISELTAAQYQHTKREVYTENAQLVAEAGIEQSVHQLNTDDSFAGYTSPQQFFNNTTQGRSTFSSTVTTSADGKEKTIVSTGKIYRNSGDTNPYITRRVRATVVGTSSSGYSVLSGPGGLILSGSASITNSEVYVGGTISLGGSSQIGTSSNPVNVDVANNACPKGTNPGPTYPQVCTDGSQPISMDYSTAIYGTVCATGQTSKGPHNNITGGNGGAGLQVGCTAPVATQPAYDRQAQIDAVTTTSSGSSGPYVCNGSKSVTWPANLKLTGNVSVGGSCTLTIKGNVYITGNLNVNGSARVKVDNNLGATRPVIMTDGTINIGGSVGMIANSSGMGIHFISFKSTASCNPNCTSVTGTDLKKSQSLETISVSGSVNSPGMIYQAYWSKVTLSGSGNIGAAAGQTVELNGSGTVIFGTTLASGSKTWAITSYQPLSSS